MRQQLSIAVTDISQVGEARRAATAMAKRSHLGENAAGRVAIIVTELATNLVRYGAGGSVLIAGETFAGGGGGVRITAIDTGPGLNVSRCLVDGFSTGGTPGNGLGAVQRLASEFDIYSASPGGTVVTAGVRTDAGEGSDPPGVRWGYVCLPAPGELLCGDGFGFTQRGSEISMMIADGLGHGPDAATASTAATILFEQDPRMEAGEFMRQAHRVLSGTRGAAAAFAGIDGRGKVLRFAGVGNISGTLFGSGARRGLPSSNGIVGAVLHKVQTFEYPLPGEGLLIMHSDGLQGRWSLESYPGLAMRHPAVIAGVLWRDFYRGRDDVTVVVCAWKGGIA